MKSGRESLAATVIHHSTPWANASIQRLPPPSFSLFSFFPSPSPSKALMPSLCARKRRPRGTRRGEGGTKRGERVGRRGWQQTPLMSQFRRSFSPSYPLATFSPPPPNSPRLNDHGRSSLLLAARLARESERADGWRARGKTFGRPPIKVFALPPCFLLRR